MKKISIVVPCYNEEENVEPLAEAIIDVMKGQLSSYDYELLFIDNASTDATREIIRKLCVINKRIKAIFNARNFGQNNSPYYGILQASGDCVIMVCADFQDPIGLLPVFVREWEKGFMIVSGIKTTSKENRIIRALRTFYYKLIKRMSDIEQIEHFTGFGLYDRTFVEMLRALNDPAPWLRGIVADLGWKRKSISYEQERRRFGKTHISWYTLYDYAMLSFTSYTKVGLRIATIMGFLMSIVMLIISMFYLILKLFNWYGFPMGMAPTVLGIYFIGAIQLFFIGLLGEYVMNINTRVMNRPLVIEECRINFDDGE